VDLSLRPADKALANEFRQWLAGHDPGPPPTTDDEEYERGVRWQAALARDRWVAIDWPHRYGGRDATALQVALCNLEYGRSGAPQPVNRVGLNLVAPTLLAWGTEEQRARWLPRIADAGEIWCQLFSEPGAGSDLAAVRTRATWTAGHWSLSGHKIWTSYAQYATWGLCLARTGDPGTADPAGNQGGGGRRDGLSLLAVDMRAPGVQVRPVRQITGRAEFNEVFLDEVEVPQGNVIGPVGRGWKVAATTLAHERGTGFPVKEQTRHERYLDRLLPLVAASGDPAARDRAADVYIRLRLLTLANLATLGRLARGRPPGPESSVVKLVWTDLTGRLSRLWLDLAPDDPEAQRQYLWSYVSGIAGGTSEIQRNIIGERILGLPREPT
jgi:alkylation response protein AidB-like acyl-CoA dehydrogenase